MDGKNWKDIRGRLVAMRGIVRVWSRSTDAADTPLALEWLRGLLGQVLVRYPEVDALYRDLQVLDDYLVLAEDALPADFQPVMQEWLTELVQTFDHLEATRTPVRVGAPS